MDITDIRNKFDKLHADYESLFTDTEDSIMFDSRSLKEALKSQLPLELSWELMTKKLKNLYDQCEAEVEEAYAEAVKKESYDTYKEITFSEAKIYAKANPTYRTAVRLLNDIRSIRDESMGVLETIKSRKFLLNNMTDAIVSSSENHIL